MFFDTNQASADPERLVPGCPAKVATGSNWPIAAAIDVRIPSPEIARRLWGSV